VSSTNDDRHPPADTLRLLTVLHALADPVRLAIVRQLLTSGESACTQLHHTLALSIGRSTFSHHQRILREAGIIAEHIRGPQRILHVRTDDLDSCFPGLLTALTTTPAHALLPPVE
jgi:DNA-binding transcriptional ArsR family regulator